jgi:hypothetical protein
MIGKRPLGRPRCRWQYNIIMNLSEVGFGRCGLHSAVSGQVPMAGSCEHGNEFSVSIKGGGFLD